MADDMNEPSALRELAPRKKLDSEDIKRMLDEIRGAMTGAAAMDYFDRMKHNHDVRFAWWPGQTRDGRRWANEERLANLMPGQTPQEARDIFPWRGAPDNRVRLVDAVIREHNTLEQLALQRRRMRVGPRNLSPDADPQAAAALWAQVDDYYADITKREFRRAVSRWGDIRKEYGLGGMYVGWREDCDTVPRTIEAAELQQAIVDAAVEDARAQALSMHEAAGGTAEDFPDLTAEETFLVQQDAAARLADLILDAEQRGTLAGKLMELDPDMPRNEARRVAGELKWGEPVKYHAVTVTSQRPVYLPLTFGINWLFPPTAADEESSPWHVLTEWLSESQLRARVESPHEPYDAKMVEKVLQHPGRAFDMTSLSGCEKLTWLLSGGHVSNVALDEADKLYFQVLHVYYRACAVGDAPAMYHTVLSGFATDAPLFHEVCEDAAGRYPFYASLSQIEAPYLLASEGYGEQSATDQNEIKIQRDSRGAEASLRIKPPLKIPMQQAGGRVDWRPGVQFPTRQTAGMGIEVMNPGTDSRGSQEVEQTTLDAFNDFWKRGGKVDAEIKTAYNQMVVSNFLSDVAAVKEHAFKLIQQYSPARITASFAGGLPVRLDVSREDIQGAVAIELDYDVAEMSPDIMGKRMEAITALLGVDTGNWLDRNKILKAVTPGLLPSWSKELVNDPQKQAEDETKDEQRQIADILAGVQFDEDASYVGGLNHKLRQGIMARIFNVQLDREGAPLMPMIPNGPNGQLSRAQRLFAEDPDVNARVLNRFTFHARQLQQQKNAQIGRQQVEAVSDGE